LSDLDFVDFIYDPVWKNIPITKIEKEIINSEIFSRLKNIRQMSLASISFSGANHTRYEHSIGTMHVIYLIASKIKNLRENAERILKIEQDTDNGYCETLQFIRLAALLHDLGHPPFSHAIEWVFERNPELFPGEKYSHDTYTRELIIRNDELNRILKGNKIVSPINIAHFLAGKLDKIPKPIAILYPLLNGDLDSDKVDYIIRDNYHCGLPVNIDIYSIMDSFEIIVNEKNSGEKFSNIDIMFKPEKLFVVENLLLSRKQLITVIQQETNNRIANQMLMASTQKYLGEKKQKEEAKDYKKLIQDFHEKWTDYDLVANITGKSFNKENQSNLLSRVIKGNLLLEILKIEVVDVSPKERLEFYLFTKYKERKNDFQKNINEKLKTDLLIDFVFINPPPLTLKLIYDFDEIKASKEYDSEPLTFALQSKSNVVDGILKDSFTNSFIAIYGENKEVDISKIRETVIDELQNQNEIIRKNLIDNRIILAEDLILLSLAAIRDFVKDKYKLSRLWATGVGRFQKFINRLKERNDIECKDLKSLTEDYSSEFDVLMTKLVSLGLIDQRKKHVSIKIEKEEKFNYKYIDRSDYCLNSNGEEFVGKLPKEYQIIRKNLYNLLQKNHEIYDNYLSKDFDIKDTIRQKDLRPELEDKGLPIIDI